jgi:hypothetical protein
MKFNFDLAVKHNTVPAALPLWRCSSGGGRLREIAVDDQQRCRLGPLLPRKALLAFAATAPADDGTS